MAINEEASDARGARWIVQNADAFVLAADSAALSGGDLPALSSNSRPDGLAQVVGAAPWR